MSSFADSMASVEGRRIGDEEEVVAGSDGSDSGKQGDNKDEEGEAKQGDDKPKSKDSSDDGKSLDNSTPRTPSAVDNRIPRFSGDMLVDEYGVPSSSAICNNTRCALSPHSRHGVRCLLRRRSKQYRAAKTRMAPLVAPSSSWADDEEDEDLPIYRTPPVPPNAPSDTGSNSGDVSTQEHTVRIVPSPQVTASFYTGSSKEETSTIGDSAGDIIPGDATPGISLEEDHPTDDSTYDSGHGASHAAGGPPPSPTDSSSSDDSFGTDSEMSGYNPLGLGNSSDGSNSDDDKEPETLANPTSRNDVRFDSVKLRRCKSNDSFFSRDEHKFERLADRIVQQRRLIQDQEANIEKKRYRLSRHRIKLKDWFGVDRFNEAEQARQFEHLQRVEGLKKLRKAQLAADHARLAVQEANEAAEQARQEPSTITMEYNAIWQALKQVKGECEDFTLERQAFFDFISREVTYNVSDYNQAGEVIVVSRNLSRNMAAQLDKRSDVAVETLFKDLEHARFDNVKLASECDFWHSKVGETVSRSELTSLEELKTAEERLMEAESTIERLQAERDGLTRESDHHARASIKAMDDHARVEAEHLLLQIVFDEYKSDVKDAKMIEDVEKEDIDDLKERLAGHRNEALSRERLLKEATVSISDRDRTIEALKQQLKGRDRDEQQVDTTQRSTSSTLDKAVEADDTQPPVKDMTLPQNRLNDEVAATDGPLIREPSNGTNESQKEQLKIELDECCSTRDTIFSELDDANEKLKKIDAAKVGLTNEVEKARRENAQLVQKNTESECLHQADIESLKPTLSEVKKQLHTANKSLEVLRQSNKKSQQLDKTSRPPAPSIASQPRLEGIKQRPLRSHEQRIEEWRTCKGKNNADRIKSLMESCRLDAQAVLARCRLRDQKRYEQRVAIRAIEPRLDAAASAGAREERWESMRAEINEENKALNRKLAALRTEAELQGQMELYDLRVGSLPLL